MCKKNEEFWRPFLQMAFDYLSNLKTSVSELVVFSTRKTGFLGFLMAIVSVQGTLFHDYVDQVGATALPANIQDEPRPS